METERPMSDTELLAIDGVGKAKLEKYGDAFIKVIQDFQKAKGAKKKKEATTYKETLELYKNGFSVEEIAQKRKLGLSTIMSHLAKLYVDGADIDLDSFISKEEVLQIAEAQIKLESPNTLKPYFDFFEEKIDYGKIRLALAILEKENAVL
jgi:ATP-dependent DNA helicase RecQ